MLSHGPRVMCGHIQERIEYDVLHIRGLQDDWLPGNVQPLPDLAKIR